MNSTEKIKERRFKTMKRRTATLTKIRERLFVMKIRNEQGKLIEEIPFQGAEEEAKELFESYIEGHNVC